MLSIVVPIRNTRNYVSNCLNSILATLERLSMWRDAEVVLIDDCSDDADDIPGLIGTFKAAAKCAVMPLRLKSRQHYSRACSLGFGLTRGDSVLLLSHDMVLTPSYVTVLLAVSALDEKFGIARGISPNIDGYPNLELRAPQPYEGYEDIVSFAELTARQRGLAWVEVGQCCGDSMLVNRAVLRKIGSMDPRFPGYFGDVDFGLRAQRAGFKLVCATGAWLHHVGAGFYYDQAKKTGEPLDGAVQSLRMREVCEAYAVFREKWGTHLPAEYRGSVDEVLAGIKTDQGAGHAEPQPALQLPDDQLQVL